MRKILPHMIAAALIFVSVASANHMNTAGQVGVSRTVSTYSLGQGSINAGVTVKADYAYHDIWIPQSNGTLKKESPVLLSQDLFFGFGLTNWMDISLDLPFYQDIWDGHSDDMAGIGDLTLTGKIHHPGLYEHAPFRVAYLMKVVMPTGTEDAGYYQRHSYTTDPDSNKAGAFTMNGWALNPMAIWTLDFNKFPCRIPLMLHANFGGIAQLYSIGNGEGRRYRSALLGSFAVEYQLNDHFGIYGEISGEAKLVQFMEGYNFTTDLNNDVIRASLGTTFRTQSGFRGAVGFDVGFSERARARTDWMRDGETYSTTNTPRIGMNVTLGYARRGKNAAFTRGRFFAPEDTVYKYDTLQVIKNDTVLVVSRDTVKVVEKDTIKVIVKDTIKVMEHADPQKIIEHGVWVVRHINFKFASASLTTESYPTLDNLVASLKKYPKVRLEIRGYTDATGPESLNKRLSMQRAESVVSYLTQKGIVKNRLKAIGMGAANPIADNKTASGRFLNRRVEIKRVD